MTLSQIRHPWCELECANDDLPIPGLWLPLREGPSFVLPDGQEILTGYHGPEEGRWAVGGDTVLVGIKDNAAGGTRYLVALDRNLKEKWRRELSLIAPPLITPLGDPAGLEGASPDPVREEAPAHQFIGVAQLDNDQVLGFRLDDGATLWSWTRCKYPDLAGERCGQPHPDDLSSHQLRAAGGLIFFYLDSEPRSLVALDARDGRMVWKLDAREIPAEVRLAYPGAPYGWSIHWNFFLATVDQIGPVVAVLNQGSDPDSLLVLDGKTGHVLWHRKWTGWGRHATDGQRGLLLSWVKAYDLDYGRDPFVPRNALVAFDLRTGQERWRYETPASEPLPFALSLPGQVFLGDRYRNPTGSLTWSVVAIESPTGRLVWRREVPGEVSRVLYADERTILYRLSASELLALSAADGAALEVGANPGPTSNVAVEANRLFRFEGRMVTAFLGSLPPVVALAIQDLAARTGLPPETITVVELQAVEWPDSSLGCPQPGFFYLQVLTPGYRLVLAAGGQRYEYHTDQGTRAVLCQAATPASPAEPAPPGEAPGEGETASPPTPDAEAGE